MSQGICKCCLREAKLCNSHIIPEFCYQPLYDEKHRYIEAVFSEDKVYRQNIGKREPLLCSECETLFNRWERHARRLFTDPFKPVAGSKARLQMPQLSYEPTKLFILSVLWRASVSQLDMFRLVNLGRHEEPIRRMLLAENAPGPDEYGCQIWRILSKGTPFVDFFVEPTYFKTDACRVYRIVMRGFLFHVFVSSHSPPREDAKLFLGKAIPLQVYDAEFDDFKFLRATETSLKAMKAELS
jgi:hypothetical protein